MKRVAWALVAVFCVAAALLWWRSGAGHTPLAEIGEPVRAPSATAANQMSAAESRRAAPPQPPQPPDPQPQASQPDYAAQLRAAPDYLEFARSLLGAARAGDHAAQFYIFRVLDYCTVDYRYYVDRGRHRSLDEALSWAATHMPYETETVRLVHARCHTFVESGAKNLGERDEWLRLASDGGYALAEVFAARHLRRDGGGDDVAKDKESRRLLSMAVRSRDAAVIWEIGDALPPKVNADGDPAGEEVFWFLAACQRGFDCSAQSDAVKALCRYDMSCQPFESVADIFRRARGNEFPELEARARWINEKIDAGDWKALGF